MEEKNARHQTPLYNAVEVGNLQYVKSLTSKGADVMVINNQRWNLAHVACFYGHTAILEYLLKKKDFQIITFNRNEEGLTPIHLAAYKGNSDCVDILLNLMHETNYFIKDAASYEKWENLNRGSTLLHAAVEGGNSSIVRSLCNNLFKIHKKDDKEMTPLLLALKMKNLNCTKELLLNGANLKDTMPDTADCYARQTALQIIISCFSQPETLLVELFNSHNYIFAMDSTMPPAEGFLTIRSLFSDEGVDDDHSDDFGAMYKRSHHSNEVEYKKFKLLKSLLACRDFKTKEEVMLHPVVESLLFLFYKQLRTFFFVILLIHIACTMLFSYMMSSKTESRAVFWYIPLAVIITWMFFINYQEYLFRKTGPNISSWHGFTFHYVFKVVTTALCLASLYVKHEGNPFPFDPTPFALICIWFQLFCLMSLWYYPGVYLNIFLTVLWKMLRVLFFFSSVVIGFALALQRALPESDSFQSYFRAMTKTLVMTNDLGYGDLIKANSSNMAVLVIVLFTLTVSIALANVLTGLAVTDVELLVKSGRVEWLLTRLEFLTDLEDSIKFRTSPFSYFIKLMYNNIVNIKPDFEVYFDATNFHRNVLPTEHVNSLLKTIMNRNV